MLRKMHTSLCAAIGGAFLFAAAAPAAAGDWFRELSRKHTLVGVAQFNHTNLRSSTGSTDVLRLMNPVSVDQVAITIIYSRANATADGEGTEDGVDTEVYLGCRVDLLTPHGALDIRGSQMPPFVVGDEEGVKRYAEIIWVPTEPVDVLRPNGQTESGYVADGLGGGGTRPSDDGDHNVTLAHPETFTLPDNDLEGYEGQQFDAVNCICAGLSDLGVSKDAVVDFKINCGNVPSAL